ncbi:craniofacial development protein 2-like [Diorhabda carinulata]|uniref:craniofacial development protein 2-like n=1 Tax=Diorhabda carinulata TaxID=1163345 RepID=UPI0025A2B6A6|nr:craniofacial development protein 2-like [Diorhabda carinulata]
MVINSARIKEEASETGRSIDDDTARKRKKRVWKENIVRLGSWNITSWSNKDYEVVLEIEKNKIDFCAHSETKKKGKGSQRYQNYILFYSGVDKNLRARGGVGLLVNKKFEKDIKEVQYISHSIIQITVELANERTHLLSIYAPDVRKPKEEREAFFDALQATLDKITSKDKVFIMGDFNSRIGNTVIPGIMHSFNEDAVNDNGDILIDVCALNELRINNTYFDQKEQQKYTFANTRGQKSTIDYIITNRKVHPSQILDVRVLTSANIGTQHGLVLCKYHVSHIIKKRKTPNYVSKFNIESLKDESIKYLYQNRLREKIVQNPLKETDNVEAAWEKLKNKIKNSAKESLGKRTIDTNRTHNKPWFTLEIKELANEKKKAYIKYIINRTQEEYEVYKRVRNRTTNTIKELKKTYWENFSVEMEHDLYGGQKKYGT